MKCRVGPLLPNKPRGVLRVDDNNTLTLGNALMRLGEHERGTARLEEAVAAYREALKELTREHTPLDWAMTQKGLGLAFLNIGVQESGTARLQEAVSALGEALKEFTRKRAPDE
jgi:hypothetical protein